MYRPNDNTTQRDDSAATTPAEARRQDSEDLKNLGLLSFQDKTGLTPVDTLFDRDAQSTKDDAKVRPIL